MKIYFATWLLEESQGIALTKKKAKNRLLSYYLNLEKIRQFRRYVRTGRNDRP